MFCYRHGCMILLHHQCCSSIFYYILFYYIYTLFIIICCCCVCCCSIASIVHNRHYHHHHPLVLLLYYYIVYNLVDKMSAEFRSTFTFGFPPPHDRVNLGILKHLTADLTSFKVIVEFAYKRERCLLLMR